MTMKDSIIYVKVSIMSLGGEKIGVLFFFLFNAINV